MGFGDIMTPEFLTCLYILGTCAALTYGSKCGQSEYLSAAGECCPMCAIGSVVLRDCHGDFSTTCKPCSRGTFMNEPNGLHACFQCKVCENGLDISQDCTTMKDTVCEVLDGYYCITYSGDRRDCLNAIKHSKCQPGEQIKTPGTESSDTVCEPCPSGFYSPEGVKCSQWTDCSVKNEIKEQEGSAIENVQCKPRNWNMKHGLIAAAVIFLLIVLLSLVLCLKQRRADIRRKPLKRPVEETGPEMSVIALSTTSRNKNQETESPDCNKEHLVLMKTM